jgi:hypothetical protein
MKSPLNKRLGQLDLQTMESPMKKTGMGIFRLPPLILHPFSTPEDTLVLMDSSRASLALQGFLPREENRTEELDKQLLRGRYAELRMLFYIGKDLIRWTEQCAETIAMAGETGERRIRPETFSVLLVQSIPSHVRAKLEGWGVLDFSALFRRSIGLHSVFAELPLASGLSPDFLRRYHRHLDNWYEQRLRESIFDRPEPDEFVFDLYASGEYTMMLEQSWGADSGEGRQSSDGKES